MGTWAFETNTPLGVPEGVQAQDHAKRMSTTQHRQLVEQMLKRAGFREDIYPEEPEDLNALRHDNYKPIAETYYPCVNSCSSFFGRMKWTVNRGVMDVKAIILNGRRCAIRVPFPMAAIPQLNDLDSEDVFYFDFIMASGEKLSFPLAFLLGHNINIMLYELPAPIYGRILKEIMKRAIKRLKENIKNTEKLSKEDKLLKIVIERNKKSIESIEEHQEECSEELKSHLEGMKFRKKELTELKKELKERKEAVIDESVAKEQIDFLSRHSKVKDVKMLFGNIYIYTKPLTIEWAYEKKSFKYDIGEYELLFDTKHNRVFIWRVSDSETTQCEYPHPCVRYGQPCWGNIQDTVSDLIRSQDFMALTDLVIRFIETYSPTGGPHIGLGRFIELRTGKYPKELKRIEDRGGGAQDGNMPRVMRGIDAQGITVGHTDTTTDIPSWAVLSEADLERARRVMEREAIDRGAIITPTPSGPTGPSRPASYETSTSASTSSLTFPI